MSNVQDISPVPDVTPQFPLVLLVDDGMTYIYGSGCCDEGPDKPPGNHPGIIFSETELDLGCGGAGEVRDAAEHKIPTGDLSNQVHKMLSLAPTTDINSGKNGEIFRTVELNSYYDPSSGLDAIGLKGKNNVIRWFTLSKAEYRTDKQSGPEFWFPILVQSRTTAATTFDDGTIRQPASPQDFTSDDVDFDFTDENTPWGVVSLSKLADPAHPKQTISIDCLLVNRTI